VTVKEVLIPGSSAGLGPCGSRKVPLSLIIGACSNCLASCIGKPSSAMFSRPSPPSGSIASAPTVKAGLSSPE
jgi:hypothetical protein